MMCMWEHIDRTNLLHVVFHAKQAQIAGLCCRVTTYINDTLPGSAKRMVSITSSCIPARVEDQ